MKRVSGMVMGKRGMSAREKESGAPLTPRERNVLKLVVRAQTNKEIARTLNISLSTAKRHLENILSKLHLKNRVEAAVYAVRIGDCPLEVGRKDGSVDGPLGQWTADVA